MHELNENAEKLKGMRIKITSTHGASGTSGPTCTTVSGLDETELIVSEEGLGKNSGMLVMKVQGLTIAGATNPLDPGCGCVMFMRSSKGKECSADEVCAQCYRQQIQIPFMLRVRETMFPERRNGAPLEPHMAIAS